MRSWDFSTAAGKLEMGIKTLRATMAVVDERWTDKARRKFQEEHLAAVEPQVHDMVDAIHRLAELLANAERQCNPD